MTRSEKAKEAEAKEWKNLVDKHVFDWSSVRNWSDVAREARNEERKIHLARVFGIMVEKGSELPDGDDRKKFKYRVVYQGNNVVDECWETAIFQDMGSSFASMEAGKMADAYGSLLGRDLEQADAEHV